MSQLDTRKVTAHDGISLHTLRMVADRKPSSGTILWVHGAFEHAGRYLPQLQWFAQKGFTSIAYDQRGHGQSGGRRMFLRTFDDYLRDLTTVRNAYARDFEKDNYVIGHSMGGLVVLRHRQVYPDAPNCKATLLSSPLLGVGAPVAAWKKLASRLIVSIYPGFAVPNDLDPAGTSRIPQEVTAYTTDPYVQKKATAGWFEEILKNLALAFEQAAQTPTPLHIHYAGQDKLVNPRETERFFQLIKDKPNTSLTCYPDSYHEILNDYDAETMRDALLHQLTN
jgi:lysophospholipase